jgi:hypothetical protein
MSGCSPFSSVAPTTDGKSWIAGGANGVADPTGFSAAFDQTSKIPPAAETKLSHEETKTPRISQSWRSRCLPLRDPRMLCGQVFRSSPRRSIARAVLASPQRLTAAGLLSGARRDKARSECVAGA